MVAHGRVELLAHPLSQKYLQMKWNSYGKYFHVTNLLIYTVFLAFVTMYASFLMQNLNYINDPANRPINLTENFSTPSVRANRFFCQFQLKIIVNMKFNSKWCSQVQPLKASHNYYNNWNVRQTFVEGPIRVNTMMLVASIAIIIYIVLSTCREFLQIYQQQWQYLFEKINFISWLLYISAAIMVSPVFNGGHITDLHFSATAVTVFLSWFNLLLFLQRFDQVFVALKFGKRGLFNVIKCHILLF